MENNQTIICKNCGRENKPGSSLCEQCGVQIENPPVSQPENPVVCKRCGRPNKSDHNFCEFCAFPLKAPAFQSIQSNFIPPQVQFNPQSFMQNPYQKPKKKKGWIIFIIVLGSLFILLLSVLFVKFIIDISKETAIESSTSDGIKETSKIYTIGETASSNGINLTVLSVKTSLGTDSEAPKTGYLYYIVTVKIKNTNKENITFHPNDFSILNSSGQILYYSELAINKDTALSSGELVSNGEVTGSIAFEEPQSDKLLLQYYEYKSESYNLLLQVKIN